MNSILDTIYSDLAAMTVTYTDKAGASATPTVYSLSSIPDSLQTAHLPCRVLLPMGMVNTGVSLRELNGAGVVASYTIPDWFLLDTAARDLGIRANAPVLISYVKAYAKAIGQKYRFIYQTSYESRTLSATITPGVFDYPPNSGVFFYGVKCEITVEELI